MKSYNLVEWGRSLQPQFRETPTPTRKEVLLKISHCGVCHSDLHARDGFYDLGNDKKLMLKDMSIALPMTLGHEIVGMVQAVGSEAEGVEIGKRYLVNPWIGCGNCAMCATGHDNLCSQMQPIGMGPYGGFSTHLLIRDAKYLIDIDGLDSAKAAPLACSGLTTYCAVKKLVPINPTEWVAVFGCGGLGLMAVTMLRGLGHERVLACDIDDTKLAAARQRGANQICNIGSADSKALKQLVDGEVYGVLDFVGRAETFALALPSVRKGGRVIVVGLFGGAGSFPIPLLAMREVSIQGSIVGSTSSLRELVAHVKSGRIQLPEVQCRPLASAENALSDLAAGRIIGRVVLETSNEGSV